MNSGLWKKKIVQKGVSMNSKCPAPLRRVLTAIFISEPFPLASVKEGHNFAKQRL